MIWIIVGGVMLAVIGLLCLVGGLGFLIYQRSHAPQLSITDPSALDPTAYVDGANNFQIQPPLGWKIDANDPPVKNPLWKSPTSDTIDGDKFVPNMSVSTVETEPATLDDYTDDILRRLQKDHPDFHLISNRRVKIATDTATVLNYDFKTKGSWPLHIQQAIIPTAHAVYIVTASTHVQTWEKHRAALESSLATFKTLH